MAVYRREETGKWFVKFMIRGVPYRRYVPEAKNKAQAQLVEAQMRQEIYEGRYGRQSGSTDFVEFVNTVYRPFAEANHKSWQREKHKLDMLCAAFRGKTLREITPMLIEGWKRKRLSEVTIRKRLRHPATVKVELGLLSSIFTMAVDNDLCPSNPCRKIKFKKGQTECKRRRVLTFEEEARLMDALDKRNPEIKRAVRLALNTGMRRMEIFNLRWRHIDLQAGTILVTKTKSGKDRLLPINAEARAVLMDIHSAPLAATEDYLFRLRNGRNVSTKLSPFHIALRDAKIEDFRFHDLRRTFAARAKNHTDAFTLQAILGHSSIDMTDLYAQSSLEDMRQAVENLGSQKVVELKKFVPRLSHAKSA